MRRDYGTITAVHVHVAVNDNVNVNDHVNVNGQSARSKPFAIYPRPFL